jgi:hypothetical protein
MLSRSIMRGKPGMPQTPTFDLPSAIHEHGDLRVREHFDRLAAEDNRGDTSTPVRSHHDQIAPSRGGGINNRLIDLFVLDVKHLADDTGGFGSLTLDHPRRSRVRTWVEELSPPFSSICSARQAIPCSRWPILFGWVRFPALLERFRAPAGGLGISPSSPWAFSTSRGTDTGFR